MRRALGIVAVLLLSAADASAAATKRFPVYPFTPTRTAAEYATDGRMELDEQGVVVFDYGTAGELGAVGRRYNPTFIATYALILYRDLLGGGEPSLRAKLLKNVDWLLDHREEAVHGGMPFWRWSFDFDYPYFKAKAPWYSSLAQARIVVAFAQAHSLTGDARYARAAEQAFRAFLVPMRNGGLVTYDGDVVWLEEMAGPEVPSSKILNGHISALAALQQYAEWTGRADAVRLVWMATEAVRRDLPKYDTGFLSWYAQEGGDERKLAPTGNYNALHVRQLAWLHELTGDPLFLDYALRFSRYEEPGFTLSAAGSTDPVRYGPSRLRLRLGSEYWSHNQFPTWVQLDFGSVRPVRSVIALTRVAKAAPRHYELLLSSDGVAWKRVAERRDNTGTRITETLAAATPARYVRLLIHSDNGNRNVALTGFTAIADGIPTAVPDWRSWSERAPAAAALVGEWCLTGPGSLVVDLTSPRQLTVHMPDGGAAGITVTGSNDLRTFAPVTLRARERDAVIHNARYRYLRLEFADVPGERAVRLQ